MLRKIKLTIILGIILSTLILSGCTQQIENNSNTTTNEDINDLTLNKTTTENPLFGSCPRGNEEPCTGECGSFVDNDNDGYCDRSFAE